MKTNHMLSTPEPVIIATAMRSRSRAARTAPIPAAREDLCLAFANTLSWRGSPAPSDSLGAFADLVGWLASAARLPAETVEMARRWSQAHPRQAAALFGEAIGLREEIYRLFSAVAAGEPVLDADLALLNRALAAAPPRERVAPADGGYAWDTDGVAMSAPSLLAPALWSAGDLLTRADRRRVRRCANDACLWLFIDESKAGTRRWCDMSSCGNRAKSRRHYLRTKQG
jgi:predicted RNA-binding Zn ribbon-like protein